MLFNSLQFFLFFAVVFASYIFLPHRWQNRMLLVASYVFYGAWDVRFLLLLMASTTLDYFFARQISLTTAPNRRKAWLTASVVTNLCILGFFKYFNFFVASFEALSQQIGFNIPLPVLTVVLPVGISFYTFQALSYTVDVYRGDVKPADRWSDFALYVAFFPQLIAGPIERATNLLPQIQNPRTVSDYGITHGTFLILWGLFQKVVIADNLSPVADAIFAEPTNGIMTLLGLYAFAIQIYCDFSGYSNIARGLAFILGFRLMLNFRNPYFASNPSDFWQRWHISLSTWLRDYLYIPLGGNRGGTWLTYRNLVITMFLGGLWHGAAWTYIWWGIFHGTILVIHRLWTSALHRSAATVQPHACSGASACPEKLPSKAWVKHRLLPSIRHSLCILFFFHVTCLGWLLFRATSMTQVLEMLGLLVGNFHVTNGAVFARTCVSLIFFGLPLLLMELWQERSGDSLVALTAPRPVRVLLYLVLVYGIVIFGKDYAQSFIYFQF